MTQLAWLGKAPRFPNTSSALDDPNGLLAVGGDLSPARLLAAYSHGIFPWYSPGQPILWWSPSPRMVLQPQNLHIGRSNQKLLAKSPFEIRVDTAFEQVIRHCAEVFRPDQDGTWITQEIQYAYIEMHRLGYAHSIESWLNDELVGGLYGMAIGRAFFGESMFSLVSSASKVAFLTIAQQLQRWNYELIDCQIYTDYLASFGAQEIPREQFETLLAQALKDKQAHHWRSEWSSTGT